MPSVHLFLLPSICPEMFPRKTSRICNLAILTVAFWCWYKRPFSFHFRTNDVVAFMFVQCYSRHTSLERHFYSFKFILSVRKLWSIYCHIGWIILRNSSVICNLFLIKFTCVLIPCISLENDHSLFQCAFGLQWRSYRLLLKYLPILKLLFCFFYFFAFPICIFHVGLFLFLTTMPSHFLQMMLILLFTFLNYL